MMDLVHNGVRCPREQCKGKTTVVQTRPAAFHTIRQRRCSECNYDVESIEITKSQHEQLERDLSYALRRLQTIKSQLRNVQSTVANAAVTVEDLQLSISAD